MTTEEKHVDMVLRDALAKLAKDRKLSSFARWSGLPLKTLTGIRLNQSRTEGEDRKITRHTRKDLLKAFAKLDRVTEKKGSPL